jgi:ubiquinone/menaquinone biosynthesis C-methylase UbiE
MLYKAEYYLSREPNAKFILASAEDTALENNSIDIITSGQAFHWFNAALFKRECIRILSEKTNGLVILLWNVKQDGVMEIERKRIVHKYREIIDNTESDWTVRKRVIGEFFNGNYQVLRASNPIENTKEEFMGRTLSASHSILSKHPKYKAYIEEWEAYFDRFNDNGCIVIPNNTVAYYGYLLGGKD